jgi:hyaluronoglucosaminidase
VRHRSMIAALAALTAVMPATALGHHSLSWRGIVEGQYGRPWTHAERMRILSWMPRHGFNAYVHAPKQDPYQRTNWRDPYPAREQRGFRHEIARASRLGIEWIPNLSPAQALIPTPGLPTSPPSRDLCFSCPDDMRAVLAKLRPFLRAGASTVMLSFADVTKQMTHRRDLLRYGFGDRAFGEANGDFLSRLAIRLRRIDPSARVLTVGADYSGTEDTPYLEGLRSTLAPGIGVLWTSTGIPSRHWTAADAHAYGRLVGRGPLVWDNWTNNDTAGNATPLGAVRIFLGPYVREPAAAGAVRGFFFNPMNEADLNRLPLATAGDWMAHPRTYRPGSSWRHAVRELAPGSSREARRRRASLRAWAETSWSNKLDPRDAPEFTASASHFTPPVRRRWRVEATVRPTGATDGPGRARSAPRARAPRPRDRPAGRAVPAERCARGPLGRCRGAPARQRAPHARALQRPAGLSRSRGVPELDPRDAPPLPARVRGRPGRRGHEVHLRLADLTRVRDPTVCRPAQRDGRIRRRRSQPRRRVALTGGRGGFDGPRDARRRADRA